MSEKEGKGKFWTVVAIGLSSFLPLVAIDIYSFAKSKQTNVLYGYSFKETLGIEGHSRTAVKYEIINPGPGDISNPQLLFNFPFPYVKSDPDFSFIRIDNGHAVPKPDGEHQFEINLETDPAGNRTLGPGQSIGLLFIYSDSRKFPDEVTFRQSGEADDNKAKVPINPLVIRARSLWVTVLSCLPLLFFGVVFFKNRYGHKRDSPLPNRLIEKVYQKSVNKYANPALVEEAMESILMGEVERFVDKKSNGNQTKKEPTQKKQPSSQTNKGTRKK